jgi:hypothetical protein
MNPRLRALFPGGSESFFKANETETDHKLPNADAQCDKKTALDRSISGKKKSLGRITLRYRLCRVRSLDPDTVAGSTKDLTDGLRRCGLIPGDNPFQITLTVEQIQVSSFAEERTELYINGLK